MAQDPGVKVDIFHLQNMSWTSVSTAVDAPLRSSCSSAFMDGYMYVIGGGGAGAWKIKDKQSRVDRMHLAGGSWTWEKMESMPYGVFDSRAASLSGKLYVVGGVEGPSETNLDTVLNMSFDAAAASERWSTG